MILVELLLLILEFLVPSIEEEEEETFKNVTVLLEQKEFASSKFIGT